MSNKKIVLVGKSCSGKTTLALMLGKYGLRPQVSTTTRPKRDYEINGVDYHFISNDEFQEKMNANQFIEVDNFNGWFYALTHEDFKNSDVLILTPRGLKKYLEILPKEDFLIIYVDAADTLRLERSTSRGDVDDSVSRRWMSDDIDFANWEQWGMPWDMKISVQSNNCLTDLVELIAKKVNK